MTRIMNEQQWRSRTVKKYKATTNSKHSLPVQDNVLNQEFTASKPNEKWVQHAADFERQYHFNAINQ
ncbi:hypothetical protein PAPH110629_19650 [Paenibacillus phoenicis]